ncbi:MAG: ankyrin repeat domain-containing protein, partial [Arenicellales bacterium]
MQRLHRLALFTVALGVSICCLAGSNGAQTLINAARNGELADVQRLLRSGVDPNSHGAGRATALSEASAYGHIRIVEALVRAGADIDMPGTDLTPPLVAAAANLHFPTLRYLVSEGAKLNLHDKYGMTALHYAAKHGELRAVALLLDAGAS